MYYSRGLIYSLLVQPKCFFPLLPFIVRLPEQPMYVVWATMTVMAIFIALGFCYRPACALFCLGLTYLILVEKTFYQSHIYLMCLLSLLFAVIPAHRMFSIDRKLRGKGWPQTIDRWQLLLLRAQIMIVYLYGGIAKFDVDWLQGRPMELSLKVASQLPYVGPYLLHPLAPYFAAYAGIGVDLTLAFLLLYKRTFWWGVAIAVVFHVANSFVFNIDIFPWLMLSALVIFPPGNWPRKYLPAPDNAPVSANETKVIERNMIRSHRSVIFALAYFALQVIIPLRHFLYPGETAWTEYGHRFAWRMMIRQKYAKLFKVTAVDPVSSSTTFVDPLDFITQKQYSTMVKDPVMILHFAHFVADMLEKRNGRRPIVHVLCLISLNGRTPALLVDPRVDLAAEKESFFPMPWILPAPPLQ